MGGSMQRTKKVCVVLVFAFCFMPFAVCHSAFEDIGAGARAIGMGNAFTGVADDASTVYYNPAGIARIRGVEVGACYSQYYPGLTYDGGIGDGFLAYAQPLAGDIGAAGIGYLERRASDLYTERTVIFSYGKEFKRTKPFSLGVSVKCLFKSYKQEYDTTNPSQLDPVFQKGDSALGLSIDIGGLYRLSDAVSMGIFLGNVNQPNIALAGSDPVPFALKCGFSFRLGSEGDYVMNTDASYRDGDYKVGIGIESWIALRSGRIELDEFEKRDDLAGWRAGFAFGSGNYKVLSAGASYRFTRPDFQADYAFIYPVESVKNTWGTHRIALTARFNPPVEVK